MQNKSFSFPSVNHKIPNNFCCILNHMRTTRLSRSGTYIHIEKIVVHRMQLNPLSTCYFSSELKLSHNQCTCFRSIMLLKILWSHKTFRQYHFFWEKHNTNFTKHNMILHYIMKLILIVKSLLPCQKNENNARVTANMMSRFTRSHVYILKDKLYFHHHYSIIRKRL